MSQEVEDSLQSLLNSMKLLNTLKDVPQLADVFAAIRTQAYEAQKIEGQEALSFKTLMAEIYQNAGELEKLCKPFMEKRKKISDLLEKEINSDSKTIKKEAIIEIAHDLQELANLAQNFGEHFKPFKQKLDKAKTEANKLIAQLEEEEKKKRSEASSDRRKKIGACVGLAAVGSAALAVPFFFGGTARTSANQAPGAVAALLTVVGSALAAGGASYAYLNRTELDRLADEFQKKAETLKLQGKELERIGEKAESQITLKDTPIQLLDEALKAAKEEKERREREQGMQKQLQEQREREQGTQKQLQEKDDEIARLRQELEDQRVNKTADK